VAAVSPELKPRIRWSRRWSALVLGVGVLVAWEAICRIFPAPDPRVPAGVPAQETITLEGDPWLLWQLRPGDRVEHGKPVHVNPNGFRDRDDGAAASGLRVMTVGDSSVYGFGVGDDEVFSSVIEKIYAPELPGIHVINGATPGWSTFQTLNMLDMRGWALAPDLLIIGNLWSDNNFDDFVDAELLTSYAGFRQTSEYRARVVFSHSALFRWLDYQIRVEPRRAAVKKIGWTLGGDGPRSGRRRVAINDYADNLDTLCARMRERNGGVIFVMLANREDVNPVSPDPAWGPYRRVMQQAAERNSVPLVELPTVFRAWGRSEDALFMDQMHPTAAGHTLIASTVAGALKTAGWPQQRLVPVQPEPHPVYADRFENRAGNVNRDSAAAMGPRGEPAAMPGTAPQPPPVQQNGAFAVDVSVPDYATGDLLLEVLTEDGAVLTTATLPVPGVARLGAVHTARVRLRLTLDVGRDGAGASDEVRELGPLNIGAGGEIPAVFSANGR
jgi:lysophospholipase L1-like esterase